MSFKIMFLLFIFYSFLGWIMEGIVVGIQEKKFVNRGFLLGPYCPIYGTGVVLALIVLKDVKNLFLIFVLGMILCGLIEYLTSYLMEKLFNARWWDYSNDKFNINGRIKLLNIILFGLGIALLFIVNPYVKNLLLKIDVNSLNIIFSILFIIYIADNFITLKALLNIKGIQTDVIKDNTEEIKRKIKEKINNSNFFNRRIIKAFPRYGINFDIIEKIKAFKK